MNILSIGNSFSHDAHVFLKQVCDNGGVDAYIVNLMIGGCSLEKHWNCFTSASEMYGYEVNGVKMGNSSIGAALLERKWDAITIQQCSGLSGRPQSYFPYLTNLADAIRLICPDAKLYIQKTWAYDTDSEHSAFVDYHRDQQEMYSRLSDCYEMASKVIDAPLIPTGDVIQHLRNRNPQLAPGLTRDGFHLSLDTGRYAAALTWYGFLFRKDVRNITFEPEGIDAEAAAAIRTGVYQILREKL